ncbi:hypothetical protein Naga_100777g2 [Nannochloropsis gaditana]|uniref:Uncharacterized protein n=1 Tax=Nannochloropsis gaditana TaxID=72520 RepID=W7SZB4_9STRA|nr:hypothetical protein Naga_100777g2 [Nannochloropsis gaditana]
MSSISSQWFWASCTYPLEHLPPPVRVIHNLDMQVLFLRRSATASLETLLKRYGLAKETTTQCLSYFSISPFDALTYTHIHTHAQILAGAPIHPRTQNRLHPTSVSADIHPRPHPQTHRTITTYAGPYISLRSHPTLTIVSHIHLDA